MFHAKLHCCALGWDEYSSSVPEDGKFILVGLSSPQLVHTHFLCPPQGSTATSDTVSVEHLEQLVERLKDAKAQMEAMEKQALL